MTICLDSWSTNVRLSNWVPEALFGLVRFVCLCQTFIGIWSLSGSHSKHLNTLQWCVYMGILCCEPISRQLHLSLGSVWDMEIRLYQNPKSYSQTIASSIYLFIQTTQASKRSCTLATEFRSMETNHIPPNEAMISSNNFSALKFLSVNLLCIDL